MYTFPFGSQLRRVAQDESSGAKDYFILGVYASAVHAEWRAPNGKLISPAVAVASEPSIFWNGNLEEAREIIDGINIPEAVGRLAPAAGQFTGPSARILDEKVLAPLGLTRKDVWLCNLLPETRLNPGQAALIREKYNPLREKFALPEVTIPKRPATFCGNERKEELLAEFLRAKPKTLITLGEAPLIQFVIPLLKKSGVNFPYKKLSDFPKYGQKIPIELGGYVFNLLPLTHPRQIGALGSHSRDWFQRHAEWVAEQINLL
jgi:hypothetical protein